MPCRSDYMEVTARELESRNIAAHLVYVFTKLKQESNITPEMTKASTGYYGNIQMVDKWTALLCATLTGLSQTDIDTIVYNAKDAYSRSLADWWERHQAWDKKREEKEGRREEKEGKRRFTQGFRFAARKGTKATPERPWSKVKEIPQSNLWIA